MNGSTTWLVMCLMFVTLSCLAFFVKNNNASRRNYIIFTYAVLMLFAFFYQPSVSADIFRYKEALEYMKTMGAENAYDHLWYIYENSQIFFLLMRMFSFFPTVVFYPCCVTLTYCVFLFFFYDSCKASQLSQAQFGIALSCLLCCVNFGIITSIVRFFIAYCLGFLGIYLWFLRKNGFFKKIFLIILIVMPTFIHSSGFLILVIWIACLLYQIQKLRPLALLFPFTMNFSTYIISFTNRIFGNNSLYLFIVEKFYQYSEKNYQDMFTRTGMFYILLFSLVLVLILYAKIRRKEVSQSEKFNSLYLIVALLVLGFLPNSTIFRRTLQLLLALTPMYLIRNKLLAKTNTAVPCVVLAICGVVLAYYSRFTTYYYM